MPTICPTITAYEPHGFRSQMERIEPFAERIHIDLMDGLFTPNQSPPLDQVWWPEGKTADIHLMYKNPMDHIDELIKLQPNLVVIHYEADVSHKEFAERLQEQGIEAGLAILQDTPIKEAGHHLLGFDHVLIFSGNLGEHGGEADLALLDKVSQIRDHHPELEISWDGGINDKNVKQLVEAGVTILNVGGFIQNAADPRAAYATLKSVIEG